MVQQRKNQVAGTLTGGEQQMLAIANRDYVLETGRIVLSGDAGE